MVNYAILGGGRLARHFSHYFQLLEIPHVCWARDSQSQFNTFDLPDVGQRLRETTRKAERLLLLVSDNAIGSLLEQYPFLHEKQLIHCSGALSIAGVAGAHPLMTFTNSLYDLQTYRSIPFIVEAGEDFKGLFPDLPNQGHAIKAGDKALYHAMCVMAGNFAQLLWQGVSGRFGQHLSLPEEVLYPYITQVASNFLQSPETSLTGPLVRNDIKTVERNLEALSGDPMQGLYRAFVKYYQDESGSNDPWEQLL